MVVRRAGERLPGGKIPVQLILNMVAQSCAGLHYAHERQANGKPLNIVHRDISPQNLVISFEGLVKVVDFGIAKAELRETKTRSGTIKGKFAYMSPEQCVANNVDRRTDVFALGVIAHELLTGRRLFKRPSPYETYQAVIECAVEPPSKQNVEIDPALDPIIMRAVAKDKEDRYPTAEAFGDAILGYLHHRGKGSGPGDVSRFFEASFGQEIEEHGARMRELISGREVPVDTWSAEEEERRREETVDLGARSDLDQSVSLHSHSLLDIDRPSAASLSDVIDELGPPAADDDMPADRTRIEQNPLEKLKELDKVPVAARTGNTPAPQFGKPGTTPAPQASTGKPTGPQASGKTPAPQARTGKTPVPAQAHQMPPSGPLPLPAQPTAPFAASSSGQAKVTSGKFPDLANLPTMIAEPEPETPPPPASPGQHGPVDPNARTSMQMEPPSLNGQARASDPLPQAPMPAARPSGNLPAGYPVMDAQMSAEMASGASVFPSQRSSQPARAGRSSDSSAHDPQRALDLASPVGQQYPEHDWAAAAPARALPPWMLAVLFLGAIGVALAITILIAKLVT